jgi:hypothetical protein
MFSGLDTGYVEFFLPDFLAVYRHPIIAPAAGGQGSAQGNYTSYCKNNA